MSLPSNTPWSSPDRQRPLKPYLGEEGAFAVEKDPWAVDIRVVVVDDHPMARVRLNGLIGDIENVECVGEAADGEAAIRLIHETRPDVAFLDIQMPGLSGLDVLRRCNPRPLAVFTTAHHQSAVRAFELQALDYMVKPFGIVRLRSAVHRARSALHADNPGLRFAPLETSPDLGRFLERIFVRQRRQIIPISLGRVEHLEARGDYVVLWDGARSHLTRAALAALNTRLDPDRFFQIHRSHVINLNRIKAITPFDGGRLEVRLESGKRIVASRTRSPELRRRLIY